MTCSCHFSTIAKLEDILEVHSSCKPATVKTIASLLMQVIAYEPKTHNWRFRLGTL